MRHPLIQFLCLALLAATAGFGVAVRILAPELSFGLFGPSWFGADLLAAIFAVAMVVSLKAAMRALHVSRQRLDRHCADSESRLSTDELTGCLNRAAFKRILGSLAAQDHVDGVVMLVFFDLNRFKAVNDTLGHDAGDQLLIEVAKRASGLIDSPWALARFGGDEFAAVVPWLHDAQAHEIGQALVDGIGRPFMVNGKQVEVGTSIGIAIGDPAIHGGDELLRRADIAMYEAKRTGESCYHIFDDMLANQQRRELAIRKEMDAGDFDQRFELHYQPIVNARSGRMEKAEALLRPKSDPLIGLSPALIVAVAENSGQIVSLTDWTIETAIRAAREIGLPVAVNLSPVYFRHSDFANRLIDKLYTLDASPEMLIVEVTESVLIADIEKARSSIDILRDVGIHVYLDDFGTGYSSLSYLQNFELDGLKLDRSFLMKMNRRQRANLIVRAMVDFGHSLGMKVVVEGVESDWQARMLQLMGCDYLQGFEVGLPMRAEELTRLKHDEKAQDLGSGAVQSPGSDSRPMPLPLPLEGIARHKV